VTLMLWCRMAWVALRLTWPFLLTPWASPLLRWRLDTYGLQAADGRLLHADEITPSQLARFLVTHPGPLLRFLRWAALL
jgi:hypothetical protein